MSVETAEERKKISAHPPPQCVMEPKFSFLAGRDRRWEKGNAQSKMIVFGRVVSDRVREDHHPPSATAGRVAVVVVEVVVVAERGFQTVEVAGGSVWW